MIIQSIVALLETCQSDAPVMPPTQLYSEGWMLRLLLDGYASLRLASGQHPLAIPPGCRWYSEALLPTTFRAERRGDGLGEAWTHADGVIGQFDIGQGAKGDLTLRHEADHLVVIEAKMLSRLSPGTSNAPDYDQAARCVACMAETLRRAARPAQALRTLGFYVLAPKDRIARGIFEPLMAKDALRAAVALRASAFGGTQDQWFEAWFLPTLERLDVRALSWETALDDLAAFGSEVGHLRTFYERCLTLNGPSARAQV
jgi:hypothetical protein